MGGGGGGGQSLSNLFAHNCLFLSRKSLKQTYRERSAPPARSRGEPLLPSARRAAQSHRESPSTGVAWPRVRQLPLRAGAGDPAGGDSVPPSALPRAPQPEVPDFCLQPRLPEQGRRGGPGPLACWCDCFKRTKFFVCLFLPKRAARVPHSPCLMRPRTRRPSQHVAQVAACSAGAAGAELFEF